MILIIVGLMLLVAFGEQALSGVLQDAELQIADYGLAVIRLILQSTLSTVLCFSWHKYKGDAAPFSVVDILKLFVSMLLLTVAFWSCIVTVILIPLGIWLYLRSDFFINYYLTGRSNGIISCIGASFRGTKGLSKTYFKYSVRYLAFYFLIELALASLIVVSLVTNVLTDSVMHGRDLAEAFFMSVFMPYRYLIKCSFYDTFLKEEKHGKAV